MLPFKIKRNNKTRNILMTIFTRGYIAEYKITNCSLKTIQTFEIIILGHDLIIITEGKK